MQLEANSSVPIPPQYLHLDLLLDFPLGLHPDLQDLHPDLRNLHLDLLLEFHLDLHPDILDLHPDLLLDFLDPFLGPP